MKYIFELTAKVGMQQSFESKHKENIEGLKKIKEPWGIEDNELPIPKFGTGLVATFSLQRLLKKGIRGHIIYTHRNVIDNYDKIWLEFNPHKIDFSKLLKITFKEYVDFFRPTEAYIYDNRTLEFDGLMRNDIVDLTNFFRFYPIFFWSEQYCNQVLQITIKELRETIANEVEYLEYYKDGVFVILSSQYLSVEQSNQMDYKLKSLFNTQNFINAKKHYEV
jgi:hypothetical protein